MLQEAQSAQHVVLDKSLMDMLNIQRDYNIHNLQITQEEHTSMINDLQNTIDNQKIVKEQQETKTHQLYDSLSKGEGEAQKIAIFITEDQYKNIQKRSHQSSTFQLISTVNFYIVLVLPFFCLLYVVLIIVISLFVN